VTRSISSLAPLPRIKLTENAPARSDGASRVECRVPSRAEPSRAEPSRAERRAEPSQARTLACGLGEARWAIRHSRNAPIARGQSRRRCGRGEPGRASPP
jgi:hypothetical protein